MQKVRDQNDVISVAEVCLERVSGDRMIAFAEAEFRRVVLSDRQYVCPVGSIDLGVRIFLTDHYPEDTVAGSDIEDLKFTVRIQSDPFGHCLRGGEHQWHHRS